MSSLSLHGRMLLPRIHVKAAFSSSSLRKVIIPSSVGFSRAAASLPSPPSMPPRKGKAASRKQQPTPKTTCSTTSQPLADRFGALDLSHNDPANTPPSSLSSSSHTPLQSGLRNPTASNAASGGGGGGGRGRGSIWVLKSCTTAGQAPLLQHHAEFATTAPSISKNAAASTLSTTPFGADFVVDDRTFCKAQIRACFYPKFENEKSDQEVRTRMIELVSTGRANLEVSLKHSGSLFMYAGPEGGAYAKNSFGNVYTAVGVYVLARTFLEAWGPGAREKQKEFNSFLETEKMCISMELVTAVLGDHGQRPLQDYVVVTAVTELGNGKPKFYSTPDIIAFCRKWRLPTNHVWLFSTRKSVTSFFAAYDALYEEGTATSVCKVLNEVADISIPGSKDHIKAQGEILEGLVARIVSPESSNHMQEKLKTTCPAMKDEVAEDLGPNLREIFASNWTEEQQQIRALVQNAGPSMCPDDVDWKPEGRIKTPEVFSKFLRAQPVNMSTAKLQEVIRLMRERRFRVGFKCYPNVHKIDSLSNENLHFKMIIHVFNDSVFRRYQKELRQNHGLWPLYRGFFIDVNLFKENNGANKHLEDNSSASSTLGSEGLADEDSNLMIKLKFLTYKLRTFLIRNGLSELFKGGESAYRTYYLRQMKIFGTSSGKQKQLSQMLEEWAHYIKRKCKNKVNFSSSTYLTEAEPFLEQYAKRNPENQALIGSAGNLVGVENFLPIVGGMDEEGDLIREGEISPSSPRRTSPNTIKKDEGLIVFFPGIPGCAKSALCREISRTPGCLEDDRPINSFMGDLIQGKYWQKIAEEIKKKPYRIILADKNAPDERVWLQIENMCRSTGASAVPVIPESEGTVTNPFSLEALAVFIFRVLQRVNHPGKLDKTSPNVGSVLLMFYHLYEGKNRRELEDELSERFGGFVQMPLIKSDRSSMPDSVKVTLEEGIDLFKLHRTGHKSSDPTKRELANQQWARWEQQLRCVMLENADYLNSIQVPFDVAVDRVLEQLKAFAKGDRRTPESTSKRSGNIVFAAVTLPVEEVKNVLYKVAETYPSIANWLSTKCIDLKTTHVTLAHKRSHGVTAVATYGIFLQKKVPVELNAFLFWDKFAAFEARLGTAEGEEIKCMNQWPHVTIWTAPKYLPKEANTLPQLVSEGKATRIDLDHPFSVNGTLDFY